MENKNNKLVIFLLIVIICLLAGGGFLGYTLLSDKANTNVNLGGSENNNNQLAGENNNETSSNALVTYFDINSFKDSQYKEIYKDFKYEIIYAEMETMFFVDSTNNKLYSTTSRDASELTEYPNIKGRVIDVEKVIPGTGSRPQFVFLLADGTVKAYYSENDIRDTGLKNIVKLFKMTNDISIGSHGKVFGVAMDSDGILHAY